jgi:hypothetical protein
MRATEQTGVAAAQKALPTLLARVRAVPRLLARIRGCAWLLLTLLLWRGQEARAADLGQPRLVLEVPRELHVGEHAYVELVVDLPAEAAEPLLVTPYREGEALEVVRGRLLRSDARDPMAKPLRFALPVLARAAGSALIGVRLLAYLCVPRCSAVEVEARANVLVLPR